MESRSPDSVPSLGRSRQLTIDALCEHFANDALPMEEFERRVEVAHRAGSVEELKELLRDLPGGNLPAVTADEGAIAPRPRAKVTAAAHTKEQGFVVAVLGGAARKGRWTPARRNFALTLMGGAELDFREALLPAGITDVQIVAIMGGVDIIVPPGVNVESHGIGIMGGFEDVSDSGAYDPNGPTVRVAGLALMGAVDIQVRRPGESARDARRRRRAERKRLRDSWE